MAKPSTYIVYIGVMTLICLQLFSAFASHSIRSLCKSCAIFLFLVPAASARPPRPVSSLPRNIFTCTLTAASAIGSHLSNDCTACLYSIAWTSRADAGMTPSNSILCSAIFASSVGKLASIPLLVRLLSPQFRKYEV